MKLVFAPDQLSTPEVIADPYPAYRRLRGQSPVNYVFIPAGALPDLDESGHGHFSSVTMSIIRCAIMKHSFRSDPPDWPNTGRRFF
jgi:hypothetical protein